MTNKLEEFFLTNKFFSMTWSIFHDCKTIQGIIFLSVFHFSAIWKRCSKIYLRSFFNCFFSTLGHYGGGSLTHQMLITCVLHIRPEGHWESHSEVGSLSPAECLVGFELGTFRFWSQCFNTLGHSFCTSNIFILKILFCDLVLFITNQT